MLPHRGTRVLTWALIAVLLAALVPTLSIVEAQAGVISYGDTVTGSITNANFFEIWGFVGGQGDRVSILMEGSGGLDPYLGLLDGTSEEVLAEDDDSAGNSNALIEMTLPAAGVYLIVATRYDLDTGTTQGDYSLTLTSGGATPVSNPIGNPVISNEPVEAAPGVWVMGEISYNNPYSEVITNDSYVHIYDIQAEGGTQVAVAMMAPGGSALDSYLMFGTEEGDLLAEDDDGGAQTDNLGPLDALLSVTIPETGVYSIIASRSGLDRGKTTGEYALMAVVRSGQPEQPQQQDSNDVPGVEVMSPMTIGSSVQGQISNDSFLHVYPFEGQAGQEVILTMTGSGQLDSYLGLMDPNEEIIAEDDDSGGGLNSQISIRLPESGTYLALATRVGLDEGTTTGAYTLEISSGTPEPPEDQTGFGGFGGLPGRALQSDEGTLYLRGLGATDNPAKASAIGKFINENSLPSRGHLKKRFHRMITGSDEFNLP